MLVRPPTFPLVIAAEKLLKNLIFSSTHTSGFFTLLHASAAAEEGQSDLFFLDKLERLVPHIKSK
jgi:hypothetical protein